MDVNYCRFCGESKSNTELLKIFDKNISDPNRNISLIIFKCFRIKIKPNDSLSKLICVKCSQQTISIFKFYEQIVKTQNLLKNIYNEQNKRTTRSKRCKIKSDLQTLQLDGVENTDDETTVKKETDDNWNGNETVKREKYSDDDKNDIIKEEKQSEDDKNSEIIEREKQNDDDKSKALVKEERYNEDNVNSNLIKYFEKSEIDELHDSDLYLPDVDSDSAVIEQECDLNKMDVKLKLETEDLELGLYSKKKKKINKTSKKLRNIKNEKQQQAMKTESQKKWAEMMKKLDEEYKDYVWKCHICVKELKTKVDLMRHFKTEHKKPPEFSCIDCAKIFTDSAKFRWHVRRHRGVPEFRCALCDKWFVLACHLKRHMYHVHEQREDQKFMCPKCGKNYKTKTSLQIHDSYVHQKRDDGLECDICHKKFHSKYSFRTHKISHGDRKFICEKCECKFITKHCLTMHIIAKHSENNTPLVPCPSCSKSFKNSKVLTQHINRMHKGDPFKYECEICGKKERDRSHYKLHLTIHSGELPHACQYCDKKFRLRSTLKVHLRQHTGERPYLCQECDRDFTCFANYLKHKRRKHGDTIKKKDGETV